jgi:hypothetical protein
MKPGGRRRAAMPRVLAPSLAGSESMSRALAYADEPANPRRPLMLTQVSDSQQIFGTVRSRWVFAADCG